MKKRVRVTVTVEVFIPGRISLMWRCSRRRLRGLTNG